MTQYINISEEGKAAEFIWRLKGQIMIDDYQLPHVQRIQILDAPTMTDKKIIRSLPRRSIVGKGGRTVDLQGWTDSQSQVDALQALADGKKKMFLHPSGDSFAVFVKIATPDNAVENAGHRVYRLQLTEAR